MPLDDLVRRVRDREPRSLQTLTERHSTTRKLARRELESAIARLDDDRRLVFMLKEVEGLSLIEHFRAGNLDLRHVARTLRRPQPMPPHIPDGVARRRHDREPNWGTS